MTELEVIKIIKEYFKANKIEIYKRKIISPLSYEVVIIAVSDKDKVDAQIGEFLKSEYHLKEIIKFDSSEALIEANKIEVDYLFFKARIDIKV